MKTIKILLLLFVFVLVGCKTNPEKEELYEVTYVIFYQNTVSDTVTIKVKGEPRLFSTEGTNYIHVCGSFKNVVQSTAPIKILKLKKLK